MPGEPNTRCGKCGAQFSCAVAAGKETCWCMALPALERPDAQAINCYCPQCLRELLRPHEEA